MSSVIGQARSEIPYGPTPGARVAVMLRGEHETGVIHRVYDNGADVIVGSHGAYFYPYDDLIYLGASAPGRFNEAPA